VNDVTAINPNSPLAAPVAPRAAFAAAPCAYQWHHGMSRSTSSMLADTGIKTDKPRLRRPEDASP
jgi:hypothetical protein